MAETQVAPPAATTTYTCKELPIVTVYTRQRWTDEWASDSMLRPVRLENACQPSMPIATFRHDFGMIRAGWQTSYGSELKVDKRGWFIQARLTIPVQGDATDEDDASEGTEDVILWTGIVITQDAAMDSPTDNGDSSGYEIWQCAGMEFVLEEIKLHEAVIDDSGTAKTIGWFPDMNRRHDKGGTVLGNRSDAQIAGPNSEPAAYIFSGDGDVWTHKDFAEYLISMHGFQQTTGGTTTRFTILITGETEVLDKLISTATFEGQSVRQALNKLMPHTYGLTWRLYPVIGLVDGSGYDMLVLRVSTMVGEDITFGDVVVEGNKCLVNIDAVNDAYATLQIRETISSMVDTVRVIGERARVCCSLSFNDSDLEIGWSAAEQTAYIAALDADVLAPSDTRWSRVFTTFRVPANWDFLAGDSAGGNYGVTSAWFDANGTRWTTPEQPYWRSFKRFLDATPLQVGLLYDATPPTNKNPSNAEPEYLKPFVVLKDTISGGTDKYCLATDTERLTGMSSATVRPVTREMAIEVRFNPQHMLGSGTITPGNTSDYLDIYWDYNEMILTAAFETEDRIGVSYYLTDLVTLGRVKTIRVPDCHHWYLMPYTVVGIEDDGSALRKAPAAGVVLRDDSAKLRAIAAFASAWYSTPRAAITFTRKVLEMVTTAGTFIAEIENGYDTLEVNALVTREVWDWDSGSVTIQTNFDELDFEGMAEILQLGDVSQEAYVASRYMMSDSWES